MKSLLCFLVVLALLLGPHAASADAAEFEARQQQSVAANPAGVTLILRLPEGRTQFHPGEIIPLTAVFAAARAGVYRLNTDPGSRDLQWGGDAFHVAPKAGVTDPLAVYYEGKSVFIYDGPGPSFADLGPRPIPIPFTLNEWLRFDVPGHYRVYLTSGRVTSGKASIFDLSFSQGRTTASNAVGLEILPDDPDWSARALRQALPLYNSDPENDQTSDARLAATRTVRFLGTPEAARAMIARYGRLTEYDSWNSQSYFQTRLGLFGSPQRALILREMGLKFADPSFPIFPFFIQDLSELQLYATNPDPLPPYLSQDAAKAKAWEARNRAQNAALAAFTDQGLKALAANVAVKRGRARAVSLYSLFSLGADEPATAARRSLTGQLVASFQQLTPEEQSDLLDNHWPEFRRPTMLPTLRRLTVSQRGDDGYMASDLRSLALRRLRALAPAEGRARLMAEIRSVHPGIDLETLRSLPDRTLPTLDKTLAAHLETADEDDGLEVQSALVQRYATRAILPCVKAAYHNKDVRSDCDAQASLLAYFLRTDRACAAAQMRKVLAARKDTGCYQSVLSAVAALAPGPDVERLAVKHLHDPDALVAADAADTLGSYGSRAGEAPLWRRLREWHGRWAGRASVLEPTEKDFAPVQGQLERHLCDALALSPAWLADRAKLQQIESLCVTKNERNNVHNYLGSWAAPLRISYGGEGDTWSVVQYNQLASFSALENKLAQFPRGTRFLLSYANFPDAQQQDVAYRRVRPFLQERGITLTKEAWPASAPAI